jgi:hypothetical protein
MGLYCSSLEAFSLVCYDANSEIAFPPFLISFLPMQLILEVNPMDLMMSFRSARYAIQKR